MNEWMKVFLPFVVVVVVACTSNTSIYRQLQLYVFPVPATTNSLLNRFRIGLEFHFYSNTVIYRPPPHELHTIPGYLVSPSTKFDSSLIYNTINVSHLFFTWVNLSRLSQSIPVLYSIRLWNACRQQHENWLNQQQQQCYLVWWCAECIEQHFHSI